MVFVLLCFDSVGESGGGAWEQSYLLYIPSFRRILISLFEVALQPLRQGYKLLSLSDYSTLRIIYYKCHHEQVQPLAKTMINL